MSYVGIQILVNGVSSCLMWYFKSSFLVNFTDRRIESIPSLIQDLIDRIVAEQMMTVKPDSCIVDFYNEVANRVLVSSWFYSVYDLH